ncbi:MAG TPA: flagellar motor protein MotB [Bryobacteraceae bacterium]|nr:flagellar motor protein MotB [Bryobacteraceae bacterium]
MARKKQESHENHERWLVSYADFITLLFAFFVVMFATSQTDKAKAQAVSDSVKKALEGESFKAVAQLILGGTVDMKGQGNAQRNGPGGARKLVRVEDKPQGKVVELLPSLQILTRELSEEIKTGKLAIHMGSRGLTISFAQAALFPSGEDEIAKDFYPSIQKIANAMKQIPNPVRAEGHTDAVPIHNSRFRSNWELSAARSIALVELLMQFGVPRDRLSIAGYADTDPVDSNDSAEGRQRNRRVDLVLLNETGLKGEPERVEPAPPVAPPKSANPAAKR